MNRKILYMNEALSFGWNAMKSNFWLFVAVLIIAGLIVGIPQTIANRLKDCSSGLSLLFQIVAWIANVIVAIGYINISLKILDNGKAEFKDFFTFKEYFVGYFAGSILYGLIVMAGFLLLIVPGIYWSLKFQFYGYCVIDLKLDPIEALRKSSRITKDVKWRLLGFGIVLGLINLVGAICLLIGLFVTIPITMIAYAYVYRKILSQTESVPTPGVPPPTTAVNQ